MNQGICAPTGFVAGGHTCGIKPSGASDLALIYATEGPAAVAGVFTRNRFAAPSVRFNRPVVGRGQAQAIVVNSGIANAATGAVGFANTVRMADMTASRLGIAPQDVLVCSTGIIGHQLPMDQLSAGIAEIEFSKEGGPAAAAAIMTTDSAPKYSQAVVELDAGPVTIGAMCKGAGMIHPNMATMLAFLTTDAKVSASALAPLIREVADRSFNMISIDGDSSTNDSLLMLASGASGVAVNPESSDWEKFAAAIQSLAWEQANAIVSGGEGVNRVFEVVVKGATSLSDARQIARTITASSLVKTAVHGADPNFGRALCAAGYSGAQFDPDRVDMFIGNIQMMSGGLPISYDAAAASALLDAGRSTLVLDLHSGPHCVRAVGCDLSAEYVAFNSEYTT